MSQDQERPENLVWATRGRSWGFRFLLNGGLSDPLPTYERIFAHSANEPTTWCRDAGLVGLRFPDPLGRRDAAGRVIPHEFVVMDTLADKIRSVGDGLTTVWPRVAGAYARVWDAGKPPAPGELSFPGAPGAD